MGRILGVDPGDVRIGLAVSDPLGVIARPLKILAHRSRRDDAQAILQEAETQGAVVIVVGVPLDLEGEVGPQARKSLRLVKELQTLTRLPIETWDESGSTQTARRRQDKQGDVDSLAAAVILQEYLDAKQT
jgi:putative Holliday junction resolvase